MNLRKIVIFRVVIALCVALVQACGTPGEGDSKVELLPGSRILGAITNQTGSQSEMTGWVVAFLDKNSEIATVAEVDVAGLFTFDHLFLDKTYTTVLLSPTYVLRSVLSHPGFDVGTVRQYFGVASATLPRFIVKGQIFNVQSEKGLNFQSDSATDQNQDGVPDGLASFSLASRSSAGLIPSANYGPSLRGFQLTEPPSTADLDNDGIKNILDPDIDNDGVPNVFDADDDGDGILDIFDLDSDGDLIIDSVQATNDHYFPSGIEWISVRYEFEAKESGTPKKSLVFTTKLREGEGKPSSVQVRGAHSFLNRAVVEKPDSAGGTTIQAWDRRLLDDGRSEDSAADDLIFAERVVLPQGTKIEVNQVFFIQLVYETAGYPIIKEFPYTMPIREPSAITASFSSVGSATTAGIVSISGDPFGTGLNDYIWAASIFDSEGKLIYTTPSVLGTDKNYPIPKDILNSGESYSFQATAQTLDRVPGYAAYTIKSLKHSFAMP
jgi:hypothetical protein